MHELIRACSYLLAGCLLAVLAARWAGRRLPRPLAPGPHPSGALILSAILVFVAAGLLIQSLAPGERARHPEPEPAAPAGRADEPADVSPLERVLHTSVALLVTSAYALLALRREGGRAADVGLTAGVRPLALALTLALIVAAVPLQIGAIGLEEVAYRLAGREVPVQEPVRQLKADPALAKDPRLVLLLVVLVPFGEEFLYRGLLLTLLLRRLPAAGGVLASAGLFAALHGAGHLPVFAQGVLLGYLYHRTRSLWPAVLFHGAHNGAALLYLLHDGGLPG